MAVEVEIIQPDGLAAPPVKSESRVKRGSGRWLALGALLAGAFAVWGLTLDDRNDTPDAVDPLEEDQRASAASEFPGIALDGSPPIRRAALLPWSGGDSVILIENSQFIYELDLRTQRRTSWAPPELLVDADPIEVEGKLIVVGETGAWVGEQESDWAYLGPADRVLPSSKSDRVWLRRDFEKTAPSDAQYLWSEVKLDGEVKRTMFRDRPVHFSTPELVSGLGTGIFRFTDNPVNPWRVLSDRGTPVASGINDLVAWECTTTLECARVWYNPRTSELKHGFYPDLAANVDVRFGSQLSDDGRFVASRSGEDQNRTLITSVANGRAIVNSCVWSEALIWSDKAELFACLTPDGLEIYETKTGTSLGIASNQGATWARGVLVESRG
jgi:hypothetical protein